MQPPSGCSVSRLGNADALMASQEKGGQGRCRKHLRRRFCQPGSLGFSAKRY